MKNPFQKYRDIQFEKALQLLKRVQQGETIGKPQLHSAVNTLVKSEKPVAIQALQKVLGHSDNMTRVMAAEALSKLGESHWQTLIQGDDRDFDKLAQSKNPKVLAVLIETFRSDPDSLARDAILSSNNKLITKILRDSLQFRPNRIPAIDILGDLKDYQATQLLINYTGSFALNERRSAIRALGRIGDKRAIEPLFNMLSEEDVHEVAAEAIIKIGGRQTIDSFIDKLTDLDKDKRVLAARHLARLGEPHWQKVARGDHDDYKRLGETGDNRFFIPLVKLLESSSCRNNPELKCAVIQGLAALKNPDCKELLLDTLLHPSKDVRRVTSGALRELGESMWANMIKGDDQDFNRLAELEKPGVVELIIRFLNEYAYDRENDEYNNAERALEKTYHPDALDIFLTAMEPGNSNTVRSHAAKALGKIGDPIAVKPLIEALRNDNDETVRIWAAKSLGKIGDPESRDILQTTLTDASGSLRLASAEALSKLGAPNWEKLIKGDSKDFSRLGSDGSSRSVDLLIAMIRNYSHNQPELSYELKLAKTALEEISNPEAIDTLIKNLTNKYIQVSVVTALGEIGDPRAVDVLLGWWNKLSGRSNSPIIKALAGIGDLHAVDGLSGHIQNDMGRESVEIILSFEELDLELVKKSLRALRNNNILENALITPVDKLRLDLASELSKSGDLFWEELIKGDNQDFMQLASSGNPRAIELLLSMIHAYYLKKPELNSKLKLAKEALASINRPEALDTLINAVHDENVQPSVIRALGEIGDPRAVSTLEELWEDSPRTDLIIDALVKIGDKTAIEGLVWKMIYHFWEDTRKIFDVLDKTDKGLAVEALAVLLYQPDIQSRRAAAEVLIKIVSSDMSGMGKRWKELRELIRNPHSDAVEGESCSGGYEHYDTRVHTDTGIGLAIPPEL